MTSARDKALQYIKLNGPILPVQISKHIGTNILLASAVLSELSASKQIKISRAAIGGSPVYYVPGQEHKLGDKLYNSLNAKEKEAFSLLKNKRVIWERQLEPWQRVALRDLKDFAVPINVHFNEEDHIFWKFHLIKDDEVTPYVDEILKQEFPEEIKEITPEPIITEKIKVIPETDLLEIKKDVINPDLYDEIKKKLWNEFKKELKNNEPEIKTEQKKLVEEVNSDKHQGKFFSKVYKFLDDNKIIIHKQELIKKDSELDLVVNIPSSFGDLVYFVKAKSKKSIGDSDISVAHSEGQLKKLPVIMLINGKLTKKATELINKKFKEQVIIKEI